MNDFYQKPGSEIVVSSAKVSLEISRAVRKGVLRKLASQLYTPNFVDSPETIVRRNIWEIVAEFMPGALICDRTAFLLKPTTEGLIYVISDRVRDIVLPGIVIKPRLGVLPLEGDAPFLKGLYLSSTPRTFIENMRSSRSRNGGEPRTLSRSEIEDRLEMTLQRGSEEALCHLRDQARILSVPLGLESEFLVFDKLVGMMLGTKQAKLESSLSKSRSNGAPYDKKRVDLFEELHRSLKNTPPLSRLCLNPLGHLPFFESYFSNFIEGTEFAVEEAKAIALDGVIPTNRPQDAHDILGTFRLTSDINFMNRAPKSAEEFLETLKITHANIMEARLDKEPGKFKSISNRAGSTLFVMPELVNGTLIKGFEVYKSLETPLHRAIFMMFLVAEVHPFLDGNGRTARLMMNKELSAAREFRIIIPTVFRDNYLQALKALSQNNIAEPLIRSMDFAQRYTASIPWESFEMAHDMLQKSNAFLKSHEAESFGKRLRILTES